MQAFKPTVRRSNWCRCATVILALQIAYATSPRASAKSIERPHVIVTTDGEIDDECSMVRFQLYANEWDIEAIVTSSSQYHWQGHKWAGDDWIDPYLKAYEEVYRRLVVRCL